MEGALREPIIQLQTVRAGYGEVVQEDVGALRARREARSRGSRGEDREREIDGCVLRAVPRDNGFI